MCDDKTLEDAKRYMEKHGISRRRFGQLAGTAALGMMLPSAAFAQEELLEDDVLIETPDGEADCYFVRPAEGIHPGVLVWPDILGLRPTFRMMGRRLAQQGYSVLVVNPFYRSAQAPVVEEGASFGDQATRDIVLPMARELNAETHITDANTFVPWLDHQGKVDSSRMMGTIGYCMGGPMVFRTAAERPYRIGAAATFHGGGLVTDEDNSPHRRIPDMTAEFLVAIAQNDDEENPQAKNTLRETFQENGLRAEVEVYPAMHGWTVPDSDVYDEQQAERAWDRLMVLFDRAL